MKKITLSIVKIFTVLCFSFFLCSNILGKKSEENSKQTAFQENTANKSLSEDNLYKEETSTEQKNLEKKNNKQINWMWLIILFEALQMIGIAVVSHKTHKARYSTIALITAFIIGLGTLAIVSIFYTPPTSIGTSNVQNQTGWRLIAGIVMTFCFSIFYLYKIAAYIIFSLIPRSMVGKLLSTLGISLSLIATYAILQNLTGYVAYGIIGGVIVLVFGSLISLVKGTDQDKEDLHGSARFANKKDLKELENEIVEPGAFILAPNDPEGHHKQISLPRNLSVMHGLIVGGAGTGKSRGYFMPNCAQIKNTSIVVTDPKSELWKYTSGFHDKALRYAPTEPDSSNCFNWIPLCTDARMSELCARAIMTAGSTNNTDQFWIDSETAFLSAIFAHTATTKYPTPLTAYRLFTRKKPEELMQILLNSPSYVAREQAIVFEQTDARIKGAIVPAVASRMQFMRDPNIQITTSAELEAPNFGQLRHTPIAVYWCLREQDIARLRPLTSLFFTVLLEQIAGEEIIEGASEIPINLMLDEFANIGKIPDFETTISLARGRGVALWLGVQSLSQLNQTYGNHAAQTIISNCATKIALHGLDYQTAEYVSRMLGEKTVSHRRGSIGLGTGGFTVGTSGAEHRRQLLTSDEVMRLDKNEAIIRTSNKYPMILYKGYYNEKPNTFPITQSLSRIQAEGEETEEILI